MKSVNLTKKISNLAKLETRFDLFGSLLVNCNHFKLRSVKFWI